MLAALEIGDHVVANRIGKFLRRERKVHADFTLRGKVSDEIGVFGSDGAGRNSSGKTETGVGKTEVGIADGAHQCGGCSQVGGDTRSGATIAHGFSVGLESHASGGFLLVENFVEEHYLARDFVATERGEFVEVVDDDNVSGEAVRRCG